MRTAPVLKSLQETKCSLACVVHNMIEDVKQYLHSGTLKSTFGVETDHLLSRLENAEKERVISNFQDLFSISFSKLNN